MESKGGGYWIFTGIISDGALFDFTRMDLVRIEGIDVYAWDQFCGRCIGKIHMCWIAANDYAMNVMGRCHEPIPAQCTHISLYYLKDETTGSITSLRCDLVPADWEGCEAIYEIKCGVYQKENKIKL